MELYTMDIENYQADDRISCRPSVRAVIDEDHSHLYMVYSEKKGFYKFPGGGVEDGEDDVCTLIREVKEETGLEVIPDTIRPYGSIVIKQRSALNEHTVFVQDNRYMSCSVKNEKGAQALDAYEKRDGYCLRIVSIEEAVKTNRSLQDLNDADTVMIERDTRLLERLAGMEQLPSTAMAQFLLRESGKMNPGPWIDHSVNTGLCAKEIAEKCGDMDPEKAYILGLLHDIGRRYGTGGARHFYDGWKYLDRLGYPTAARIALTHSFSIQKLSDYIGPMDLSEAQQQEVAAELAAIQYDDYDRLIQLCDAKAMADKITTIQERMGDVKRRYGCYPHDKWEKNEALEKYFQMKMQKHH